MTNKYLNYWKDNPQGYWFKAKLFGWSWTPVKWQGWVTILVYVALLFLCSLTIGPASSVSRILLAFVLPIALLTAALIRVCYLKGEKPRWQWGLPKDSADSLMDK